MIKNFSQDQVFLDFKIIDIFLNYEIILLSYYTW